MALKVKSLAEAKRWMKKVQSPESFEKRISRLEHDYHQLERMLHYNIKRITKIERKIYD